MLWIKALHLIFMVTWFAGLFYLPRLFVYHAMSTDEMGLARFKTMERKLYYGIMYPSGILTTVFGLWLLWPNFALYMTFWWMQVKLVLVGVLWVFHLSCGYYRKCFANHTNAHSHVFYRWFNEVPSVILFVVIILVVVKP